MIRKLLTVGAAMAAVLAVAAPANAAIPGSVEVGSSTSGAHAVAGVSKGSLVVTVAGQTLGCASASASGSVYASSPVATPYMDFDTTSWVGCTGPGGLPMNVTQDPSCTLDISLAASAVATNPVTDNPVDSELSIAPGCLTASDAITGTLCTLDIVGNVDAFFDENVKTVDGVDFQELTISGDTLLLDNVDCFGAINDGDHVDMTVVFNNHVPDGLVNFKP